MRRDAKASSAGSNAGSGEGRGRRSLGLLGLTVLVAGLLTALLGTNVAQAAPSYADIGEFGFGELGGSPTKLAVDSASGDVLVVDRSNNRVVVYDAGIPATQLATIGSKETFASPYGIAIDQGDGAVYVTSARADETQVATVENATGGTFTLAFEGQATGPLAFDADTATVRSALEGLSTVGVGNVDVAGGAGSYVVTFEGSLGETNLEELVADGGNLEGSGAAAAVFTAQPGVAGRIAKFYPDNRANPTAYSEDPTFVSPARGSDADAGQVASFASALAVDPTNGDLLIADSGNAQISRFTANGTFVSSFDGHDSPVGSFQRLLDLAVGSDGTLYVVANGVVTESGEVAASDTLKFAPDGSAGQILPGTENLDEARAIAFDPVSSEIFVTTGGGAAGGGRTLVLNALQGGDVVARVEYPGSFGAGKKLSWSIPVGLAPSGRSDGYIYGLTAQGDPIFGYGAATVQIFKPNFVPDLSFEQPSEITTTSAHLSGTIDPGGEPNTHYHFEYLDGGSWISTEDKEIAGAPNEPVAVSTSISGLTHITEYQVRLVASTPYAVATSQSRTFKTLPILADVVTGAATNLSSTGGILRGSVNSNGAQTSYHFEYGLTPAYGSRTPAGHEAVVGNGRVPSLVSQPVDGLQPGTTYHYRLIAANGAGTEAGEDRIFTTLSPAVLPQRAYELVSPADKGGNNVKGAYAMQASADGNAILYSGTTVLADLSPSAPAYPFYVSRRSGGDWLTKATDPPLIAGPSPVKSTFGVSDDGTKAVVLSQKKLASGAVEGQANVYLHDLTTGTYTTMATTLDANWYGNQVYTGNGVFVQGTKNFDHVLISGNGTAATSFLPGVPPGALYEFSDGALRVVSFDQSGAWSSAGTMGFNDHDKRMMSADGSRIVYQSDAIHLRSDGVDRVISESNRASDPPGTIGVGNLVGGDRDLNQIYFFSQNLTDSSIPDTPSLYRYDADTESLEMLSKVANSFSDSRLGYLEVSADGSSVFFSSGAKLTPDAEEGGGANIYVWRKGTLSLVAHLDGNFDATNSAGAPTWWASPNGRYFVFAASTPNLAGYNTLNPACTNSTGEHGACFEIYRYDTEDGETICVSCRPDGKQPLASAYMGPSSIDTATHSFLRAVTDQGQVFFDTIEQLVPADTGSTSDVYEYNPTVGNRLISSGHGLGSRISEVSMDGSDVFFTTKDRLVGIDSDKANDVYDARVDGGLSSQNPPPLRGECIRDDCKAAPNGGPELPFGGSEGLSGPQNVSAVAGRRCGKGRQARKVKGKRRCVKQKKQAKEKSRASHNRRQGR